MYRVAPARRHCFVILSQASGDTRVHSEVCVGEQAQQLSPPFLGILCAAEVEVRPHQIEEAGAEL